MEKGEGIVKPATVPLGDTNKESSMIGFEGEMGVLCQGRNCRRGVQASCFVRWVGEKGRLKGDRWYVRRCGTRLARHAHVVVFEAKGVGDPRIFGAGLGGEATSLGKGETDDGGEVRRRC